MSLASEYVKKFKEATDILNSIKPPELVIDGRQIAYISFEGDIIVVPHMKPAWIPALHRWKKDVFGEGGDGPEKD